MRLLDTIVSHCGLMLGLTVAALGLTAAPAAAAPGDIAVSQDAYPAILNAARSLRKAVAALDEGRDIFKGHRVKAIADATEALGELDKAVKFAEANGKQGEKAKSFFDPERGKLAVSPNKYPAIQAGARNLIIAGNYLDAGRDIFGGHRVNALRAIHRALDQLEAAVKSAN
jgi:hypothetical protein